jgi:hypothetical protein
MVLATAAFAARPTGLNIPITPGTELVKIGVEGTSAACVLGEAGAAAAAVGYVLPPDDAYYTLLKASDCTVCGAGGYKPLAAHVGLYFVAPGCVQPVRVAIVGSTGGPCPLPDLGTILCPEVPYVIDATAPGFPLGAPVDVSLPLPAGCCILGDAFLKVVFDLGTCDSSNMGFLTSATPCAACTQWNIYPGGGPDDICTVFTSFGYNLIIMNVEADCCVTSATPKSWGQMKSLYR